MTLITFQRCSSGVLALLAFLGLGSLVVSAVQAADDATAGARETGSPTAITWAASDPNPPIEGRVDPATYRVGPGDEFALRYSNTSDPRIIRVGPVGDLLLPYVGAIPVAGLTLSETEALVRERFRRYAGGKTLVLTLYRPRRFRMRVQGEVTRPGAVTLQAPARASEAIAAAGGVAVGGAQRGIQVLRGADTLLVDLVRAARGGDPITDPFVFESDILFVPARGSFVEVLGAVPHTGRYDFLTGDRLSGLVVLAGGVLPEAAPEYAELTRFDARGLPTRMRLSLRTALAAPGGPEDLQLVDGDRLFIPSRAHWREGVMVEVMGEVVRPGPYPVTEGVDRVRDLLERAGGYTEYAERGAVRIERQFAAARRDSTFLNLVRAGDPVVTVTDREIAFLATRERQAVAAEIGELLERGDESGNTLLLPGDRIVVPPHRPIVSVQGEVRVPGYVHYMSGRKLWDYIADAGGLTKRADRRHVRVTIATTGQHVSAGEARELRPLDTIWVPPKRERSSSQRVRDLFVAVSQVAAVYLVVREATK
jgi:protein involved in polysaccharide export with SLBB domain